ncbi:5-(carboxyamino)imidazole ribonucleotide mutase [candidate division LCP-89 bacterium B3_LCP]|uniref:N5-carboxyaminoimidazole ribonucleotide mutase n=1 Tax=candidate division LCP-89 bacterium B3_LCP TaxID=2012998 RepID=A0A532UTW6_UNCL8|nr:MAG: 5-(carboxyamino)imidazole ribonucleotide mutase [candidate division LCP-89 bacterium B3_LCP]
MQNQKKVLIVMGSESDRQTLEHMQPYLDYFGISADWHVSSAHRQPDATAKLANEAADNGYALIIAAAGMAAHLAGACAAHSLLPVIAIPLAASSLQGMDALLSSVQMPAGIPVGVTTIGKPGAINAACLSARILAVTNPEILVKLEEFRQNGSKLP